MMSGIVEFIGAVKSAMVCISCFKENCICVNKVVILGICTPLRKDINFLTMSLFSENTKLIDLDAEINNHLSNNNENVSANIISTPHEINKLVFQSGHTLVDELTNIYQNVSNQTKNIIYLSKNYRLLKFSNVSEIEYYMPSDNYVNSISNEDNFDMKEFNAFKNDLMYRKSSKITIYNGQNELLNEIKLLFPELHLKI